MSDFERTKGHAARLIRPPGYHIHPQWDLVHLRALLANRSSKKKTFQLSLAPMVDMFSILVIYLLMNFSSTGEIFFVSKDIVLPRASKGTPMKSYPLISIVGDKVVFDAEKIEGQKSESVTELNNDQVPKLREMLGRLKRVEQQIDSKKPFKGQVNLQADNMTKVDDVKRIMRVLIEEGWTGINFVVDPRDQ